VTETIRMRTAEERVDSVTLQLVTGITRTEWLRRDDAVHEKLEQAEKLSDNAILEALTERRELEKLSPVSFRTQNAPNTLYRLSGSLGADACLAEEEPKTSHEVREQAERRANRAAVDVQKAYAELGRRRKRKKSKNRGSNTLKDAIRRAKRDNPGVSQAEIAEATDRILTDRVKFRTVCPPGWRKCKSVLEALACQSLKSAVKRYISGVK
jgi:hypothetical protein